MRGVDMKVGVCSIAWKEQLPIIEVLDTAARIGFDGVELWGRPPHTPEKYDEDYVTKLRKAFDERDLIPSMFGSYVYAGTSDFEKQMDLAIKNTLGLGTDLCRIWADKISSADADAKTWERVVADMKMICKEGRRHGLVFAIERHNRTLADSLDSTIALVERVGAENLAINYQVWRDRDPESIAREIRTLGDLIVNVHTSNPSRQPSEERGLATSREEDVDYAKLVEELKAINFDRFVEVEFTRRGRDGELDLEAKEKELKKDCQFLRKMTR
jgi:sugar phosphate isomerase/epimerase